MLKIIRLLIRFFSLGFVFLIVACDFEMDDFGSLEVGQTPDEVLQKLMQQGIQDIAPLIDNLIVIKHGQIDQLDKLYYSSGVCLTDNKGLSMNLRFDDNNNLLEIYTSQKMGSETFGIEVNQKKSKVLSLLKKAFVVNNKFVIANCIVNFHWVRLNKIEEGDVLYLKKYSTWRYHESGSFSYITLRFSHGKLSNMTYHWRPYET